MNIHTLWDSYPELRLELTETLLLMEKSIQLKNKEVEQLILSMIRSGGKLLRPAYQLLFSQFGSETAKEKAIALAAAIELLHTATLIHDDVIDNANFRRNIPTIHTNFSTDIAVYAGDYLFICCFKLLSAHASSLKSIQMNTTSLEKILTGELGQMNLRYQTNTTIEQYIDNISGKTAELFALSCFVGAFESGTSELFAKKCGEIGLTIGLAFQIMDDVLDYTKQHKQLGKPVLEDIRQGIYSLPLLYALETNSDELLPYLEKKENITDNEIMHVHQIIHSSGAINKAKKMAESYTNQAIKKIKKLPETSKNTKNNLLQITTTILTRVN